MDIYGIHATPPLALADREKWKSSIDKLKQEQGKMEQFSIQRADGLDPSGTSRLAVSWRLGLSQEDNIFRCQWRSSRVAEVVAVAVHPQLGTRPKTVAVKTFDASGEKWTRYMPVATWTFQIDRSEIKNKEMEEKARPRVRPRIGNIDLEFDNGDWIEVKR